jgi:hypothetical protein
MSLPDSKAGARVVNPYVTGNNIRCPCRSRGNKKSSPARFGNDALFGDLKGRVVWPNLIRFGKTRSPASPIPCPAPRCRVDILSSLFQLVRSPDNFQLLAKCPRPDIRTPPMVNLPTVSLHIPPRHNRATLNLTACRLLSPASPSRNNPAISLRRRNPRLMANHSSRPKAFRRIRMRPLRPCRCPCRLRRRSLMLHRHNR